MNVTHDPTTTTAPELELEELLSESPNHAAARAASQLSLNENSVLALYGAGQLGREVLARLRSLGIKPAAFVDDTPAKLGTEIDGLAVVSPREFVSRFRSRAVLVVTIFNPTASFRRIKRAVQSQINAPVVSFLELAWNYPDSFLPHYQFEQPGDVLGKGDAIRRGFQLFTDEESRRQFVAHLRFRLHLDFDALPDSNPGDYFPRDVIPALPEDCRFVDCGAFEGDTIGRFIARTHGRFREIYAFEPDAENFRKLKDYAATLPQDIASRIHLFQAAAGAERGRRRFDPGGGMASALSESGAEEVEVRPVQDVVTARSEDMVFLKFDVEGAEAAALAGAVPLISRDRTIVAVCVYHRPDDLWELPMQLRKLAPEHRLYLRTQGEDGMDVVCYSVPQKMAST